MKVVTDLSKSFNPVPKNSRQTVDKTAITGQKAKKSGQKRTERRILHNAKEYTIQHKENRKVL